MQISLPSEAFIRDIHQLIIDEFDDEDGDLHPEIIGVALERAKQYIHYEDCNFHKVFAVILDTLANRHPFLDGNKRTALITVIIAYRVNGVDLRQLDFDQEDFVNLMLWVVDVEIKPSIDAVAEKLKELVEKYATKDAKRALLKAQYNFE